MNNNNIPSASIIKSQESENCTSVDREIIYRKTASGHAFAVDLVKTIEYRTLVLVGEIFAQQLEFVDSLIKGNMDIRMFPTKPDFFRADLWKLKSKSYDDFKIAINKETILFIESKRYRYIFKTFIKNDSFVFKAGNEVTLTNELKDKVCQSWSNSLDNIIENAEREVLTEFSLKKYLELKNKIIVLKNRLEVLIAVNQEERQRIISNNQQTLSDRPTSTESKELKNQPELPLRQVLAILPASQKRNNFFTELGTLTTPKYHTDRKVPQIRVISSSGTRYLKPEIIELILDDSGNLKSPASGSSSGAIEAGGFCFMQNPAHPLMEYAIYQLFEKLSSGLIPETELVRFEVDGDLVYPVLISKSIKGIPLKQAMESENWEHNIQWKTWTWLLLGMILTRPGDGRISKFIIDVQGHIRCIENQISFVEPFEAGRFSSCINFCSTPFCLFQDRPLDPSVLEAFFKLDAHSLLVDWIDDVIQKEREYLKLFSVLEREKFYQSESHNKFSAALLLREGTLATLNAQFVHLQNKLGDFLFKGQSVTPLDLLSFLISIREPADIEIGVEISKAYQRAEPSFIEERLLKITGRTQNSPLTFLEKNKKCLGVSPTFEDIDKKKAFSAEKAKEELTLSLSRKCPNLKISESLFLQVNLCANFEGLKDGGQPDLDRQLSVLKSLAFRAHLKPQPNVITLQNCVALNTASLEPFLHEDLLYLDLRGCSQIKNSDLELIQNRCPRLVELNISGCLGLTGIKKGFFQSEPLAFPMLKIFLFDDCSNLECIYLKAPNLLMVKKTNCNKLKLVQISTIAISVNAFYEERLANFREISCLIDFEGLEMMSHNLLNYREIIINGLKNKTSEISQYLFQKNPNQFRELILAHVKQDGLFLQYAGVEMQNDRAIVLEAVKQNGLAFQYASLEIKADDFEITLRAVKSDGLMLRFTVMLQSDRRIVFAAVQQNGLALQYVKGSLRNDCCIVKTAIEQNPHAEDFLSGDRIDYGDHGVL